jgi:hypothetical protein
LALASPGVGNKLRLEIDHLETSKINCPTQTYQGNKNQLSTLIIKNLDTTPRPSQPCMTKQLVTPSSNQKQANPPTILPSAQRPPPPTQIPRHKPACPTNYKQAELTASVPTDIPTTDPPTALGKGRPTNRNKDNKPPSTSSSVSKNIEISPLAELTSISGNIIQSTVKKKQDIRTSMSSFVSQSK